MSEDTARLYAFPQSRTEGRQAFPSPADGETVAETPPALVWLLPPADRDGSLSYRVTVKHDDGTPFWEGVVNGNTAVPDRLLPPGGYRWNVVCESLHTERGWKTFTVPADAVRFLRPTADEVLSGIPAERPRHLFCSSDIGTLRSEHTAEMETLMYNVSLAYKDGMPSRPMYHRDPDALPYREYFGRFRDFCDRDLVACALGYHLFEKEEDRVRAGAHAKQLFFTIADWNPAGPCSLLGTWGDEVGLSCARILPSVFDLLYPLFSDKERFYAAETVAAYAYQCEKRLDRLNYTQNPGDSHAGRLPAYLGEAALVLHGVPNCPVPDAVRRRWLEKALTIYGGIFPYFGGKDGAWAEGTFYSTSYTKWFLPFFSAVNRYTENVERFTEQNASGSFFSRPFYRNYARYLLHFALPDHEIHPFGDGYWCSPESPEWPGFFAQNPFRVYAALSGLPEAEEYDRMLAAPKAYALHLLDVFLPGVKAAVPDGVRKTAPVTDADVFPDIGLVSLHSDRTQPQNDLHIIARADRFGSGSHRQPDEGAFVLFYGGTALLCPSGYFGREYGTQHHMQWLNTTKAHNAILIDGVGQTYRDFTQTGKIVSCEDKDDVRSAVLDLSAAYPMLTGWTRTIRILDGKTAEIEDRITADRPVTVTWCLHTLSKPEQDGQRVTVSRNGVALNVVPADNCFADCTLSDTYDVDLNAGVPEAYHVTMPEQFHTYYTTEKKSEHVIRVTMHIS